MQSQVLYVVPITSILGRLALVPVGDTGTIPFSMRTEKTDYPGAIPKGAGDAIDGPGGTSTVLPSSGPLGHKPVNHKNSPYLLCHC